jgi:hypothetical protein
MTENTDVCDETSANSINKEPANPSDDIVPSVNSDNITQKQQTENMETHAHHLHKAPGNKFRHFFFEFLILFLAVAAVSWQRTCGKNMWKMKEQKNWQ